MLLLDKLRVTRQEYQAHRLALKSENCLEMLILYVTSHCNMRCGHCFFADNLNDGSEDLSPERAGRIFANMPFIRDEIAITGGEPFLHRKLPELVRQVHDAACSRDIQINTNGFYTDRILACAEDMAGWNRKRISVQISLDGLEATHDRIRGIPGAFQKAMRSAESLMKLQRLTEPGFFTPVFLMIINQQNYMEIRPLSEMIRKEFGLCLGLELVRGSNFSAWKIPEALREESYNPPEIALPPREAWDQILREIQTMNREMGLPFRLFASKMKTQFDMLLQPRKHVECVAPEGLTPVIYSNGDVATCEFAKPFANLGAHDDDFMALWGSPEALRNRAALRQCYCTHACFLVPSMRRSLGKVLRLMVDL